jgi:hypothetical protein
MTKPQVPGYGNKVEHGPEWDRLTNQFDIWAGACVQSSRVSSHRRAEPGEFNIC